MFKLLIADDEPIERAALTLILRNANLEIELIGEAVNGRQAVAKALKYLPDIVIMDIKMPGVDGLEASRQIKDAVPGCKIVILTAYSYFDYAQTAIQIGVDDYVVKPVNPGNVVKVVQKVMIKLEEEHLQKSKYLETETKLRQVTQYFANEILSSMVAGDIEEERIGEYIQHLGISFKLGIATILAFNNESSAFSESKYQRGFEHVRETISKYGVQYLLNQQGHRMNLLLVLNDPDDYDRVISAIFNELENAINGPDCPLSIGVSQPFTQLALVSKAFFQARLACNKSVDRVIFYSEFTDNERSDSKYPLVKEKLLYEMLTRGEEEGTLAVFHEIWDWMVHSSETKEALKEKAYQFMVIIHRLVIEEFNIDDQLEYDRHGIRSLKQLNELERYCQTTLLRFLGKIQAGMKEPSALIIEEVCHYIGENYMNELTLDHIASRVGFSRFYFSKLFKQYKGMNFIDYLTLIRINKSKELLKNPKLSVKDISYTVGYSDPNYYTSVFKKAEGLAPTEYRNRCLS